MIHLTFLTNLSLYEPEKQDSLFRILADNGVEHLVLSSTLLGQFMQGNASPYDLLKKMKGFGLDFVDSHALWGAWSDPGIPLEEPRKLASMRAQAAFHICKMLNIHTMAFHTGNTFNNIFGNKTIEDYWNALVRSLEEMLPEAEKCNVIIALENQWTPLNHSKYLLKAVQYFHSPCLKLCLDTGHAHLMEKGQDYPGKTCVPIIWNEAGIPVEWDTDVMDRMQPYLVNCHLHDNNGIEDQHQLPGCGDVDWKHVKKVLAGAPLLQSMQPEITIGNSPESVKTVCNSFRNLFADFD